MTQAITQLLKNSKPPLDIRPTFCTAWELLLPVCFWFNFSVWLSNSCNMYHKIESGRPFGSIQSTRWWVLWQPWASFFQRVVHLSGQSTESWWEELCLNSLNCYSFGWADKNLYWRMWMLKRVSILDHLPVVSAYVVRLKWKSVPRN